MKSLINAVLVLSTMSCGVYTVKVERVPPKVNIGDCVRVTIPPFKDIEAVLETAQNRNECHIIGRKTLDADFQVDSWLDCVHLRKVVPESDLCKLIKEEMGL